MKPVLIVSTFQRGGSSLTMQMLHAAGVRCAGSWPSFEDMRSTSGPTLAHLIDQLCETTPLDQPCAVKVLEPQRMIIPQPKHPRPRRVIWLDRDPRQRAKSAIKFIRAQGWAVDTGRLVRRKYETGFRRDRAPALASLQTGFPGHRTTLRFEDIVTKPTEAAEAIAWLAGLEKDRAAIVAMANAVRRRKPACLAHMLELDLITERSA